MKNATRWRMQRSYHITSQSTLSTSDTRKTHQHSSTVRDHDIVQRAYHYNVDVRGLSQSLSTWSISAESLSNVTPAFTSLRLNFSISSWSCHSTMIGFHHHYTVPCAHYLEFIITPIIEWIIEWSLSGSIYFQTQILLYFKTKAIIISNTKITSRHQHHILTLTTSCSRSVSKSRLDDENPDIPPHQSSTW